MASHLVRALCSWVRAVSPALPLIALLVPDEAGAAQPSPSTCYLNLSYTAWWLGLAFGPTKRPAERGVWYSHSIAGGSRLVPTAARVHGNSTVRTNLYQPRAPASYQIFSIQPLGCAKLTAQSLGGVVANMAALNLMGPKRTPHSFVRPLPCSCHAFKRGAVIIFRHD